MIQFDQEENENQFNQIHEQMMESYFHQGKLYYLWNSQLRIIINNNIQYRNYYQQFFNQYVNQKQQQYTLQQDEIIFIGEKFKLNDLYICQLLEKKFDSIHFKILQQIFWLVWIKCLRSKLKSSNIGKIIAQFSGFDCLDLIDISGSRYESYLIIINFVIVNGQQQQKYIYFEIRKLEPNIIQNITVGQLLKERIFFSGTENFEIQNQQICNLQNKKDTELQKINQNKARYYLKLKSEYMNALLITANASFIKVLLVPNEENDYQLSTDDANFSTEFQKYNQILPMLKFINGNWQIEHDYLFRKIEKNQAVTIKRGRIITTSNQGITDHELIFNWKTKLIQFNVI